MCEACCGGNDLRAGCVLLQVQVERHDQHDGGLGNADDVLGVGQLATMTPNSLAESMSSSTPITGRSRNRARRRTVRPVGPLGEATTASTSVKISRNSSGPRISGGPGGHDRCRGSFASWSSSRVQPQLGSVEWRFCSRCFQTPEVHRGSPVT
jgi:hypothetical protein